MNKLACMKKQYPKKYKNIVFVWTQTALQIISMNLNLTRPQDIKLKLVRSFWKRLDTSCPLDRNVGL